MALATKDDGKNMATDLVAPGEDNSDRDPEPQRPERAQPRSGFFSIYKQGQGYWTRICSAVGAGMIVALSADFIYSQAPAYISVLNQYPAAMAAVVGAYILAMAIIIWQVMNRPGNVDFLIATDSEMKKVNWTSRGELVGSTKIVILFMFMIAALLFGLDLYFTRIFYLLGVLATDAPLWISVGAMWGLGAKIALDVIMGILVIGGAVWAVYSSAKTR